MFRYTSHFVSGLAFTWCLFAESAAHSQTTDLAGWTTGVEVGKSAPLGAIGAYLSFAPKPYLSFGFGMGVGSGYSNTGQGTGYFTAAGAFSKIYFNENSVVRFGLSLGVSLGENEVVGQLQRPNHPAESIHWRTPYGLRLNQSLFAEFRYGRIVTNANIGLARGLSDATCSYRDEFAPLRDCDGLGLAPNEPSPWIGMASVGFGWALPRSSRTDDRRAEADTPSEAHAPDPRIDRTGMSPTANTLRKGALSLSSRELLLLDATYGLTDRTQISLYVIPLGVGVGIKSQLFAHKSNRIAWLLAGVTGRLGEIDRISVATTGPIVTHCFDENCDSMISGHAMEIVANANDWYYHPNNPADSTLVLGISGKVRLSNHVAVMIEAHDSQVGFTEPLSSHIGDSTDSIVIDRGQNPVAIASLRFMSRSAFLDAGAMIDLGSGNAFPAFSFGWTRF